jgi:hypothetical protein
VITGIKVKEIAPKLARIVIYDNENPPVSIDRREALERAEACNGMSEKGHHLAVELAKAANSARKIEKGVGYSMFDAFMSNLQMAHKARMAG